MTSKARTLDKDFSDADRLKVLAMHANMRWTELWDGTDWPRTPGGLPLAVNQLNGDEKARALDMVYRFAISDDADDELRLLHLAAATGLTHFGRRRREVLALLFRLLADGKEEAELRVRALEMVLEAA